MAVVVAKIYILRHAETAFNRQELVQGQLDTPLHEAGELQAELAANALKDVPFGVGGAAYTSDLERARKTAEIILKDHPGVKLETVEALRERFSADWQGGSVHGRGTTPPDAESHADVVARSVKWWNETITEHVQRKAAELETIEAIEPTQDGAESEEGRHAFDPAHILVVSHGGVIGRMVPELIKSSKVRRLEGVENPEERRCATASISIIETYEDGKGVLVSYADTTHLSKDLVQEGADD
ncbi:phosphoglycerate mutase-like protein [Trametes cingulata]|nr:phosphoglycerate mutase-like protein [Trametes cingulata]